MTCSLAIHRRRKRKDPPSYVLQGGRREKHLWDVAAFPSSPCGIHLRLGQALEQAPSERLPLANAGRHEVQETSERHDHLRRDLLLVFGTLEQLDAE